MAAVQAPAAPLDCGPPAKRSRNDVDCEQCGLVKSKYTCPKCATRTCSLACVKLHKEKNVCDGQRPQFPNVKKYSHFDDKVSIKDQEFIQSIKDGVSCGIREFNSTKLTVQALSPMVSAATAEPIVPSPVVYAQGSLNDSVTSNVLQNPPESNLVVDDSFNENSTDQESDFLKKYGNGVPKPNELTSTERYLISNAIRRRIFITVDSPADTLGSRYEQFSDCIHWSVSISFMREIPPTFVEADAGFTIDTAGEEISAESGVTATKGAQVDSYTATANSIPESLTVNTLIRQFVKPRIYGPVVSKNDLNAEKMQAFWDAGLDGVNVFMRVPVGEKERYYLVDKTKTVLDNLRNRFVVGHPKMVVTLPNEFKHWQCLTEMEAQELHDERRQKHRERNHGQQHHGRGRGRGGRGFGNRGGGFRGRGGRGRGFGGRGGRQNDNLAPCDLAEIFEPPTDYRSHRPSYNTNQTAEPHLNAWASAVSHTAVAKGNSSSNVKTDEV